MNDLEVDSLIQSAIWTLSYNNPEITDDELESGLVRYLKDGGVKVR